MECTIRVAKTKALISFAVTAKLICVFVFAYAKTRFSHDAAHFVEVLNLRTQIKMFGFTVDEIHSKMQPEGQTVQLIYQGLS